MPVSQRTCAASAKPPDVRQCVRYRGTWGASDWSEVCVDDLISLLLRALIGGFSVRAARIKGKGSRSER